MPWDNFVADGDDLPFVEIFLEPTAAATQVMIQQIDLASSDHATLHLLLADGSKMPVNAAVSTVIESELRPSDIAWIRPANPADRG